MSLKAIAVRFVAMGVYEPPCVSERFTLNVAVADGQYHDKLI